MIWFDLIQCFYQAMHEFSRMSRPYLTYNLPTALSGYYGFTTLSQSKEKTSNLLLSSLTVC
jgi:hypothetical protein